MSQFKNFFIALIVAALFIGVVYILQPPQKKVTFCCLADQICEKSNYDINLKEDVKGSYCCQMCTSFDELQKQIKNDNVSSYTDPNGNYSYKDNWGQWVTKPATQ